MGKFSSKAQRTGKCTCENPKISVFETYISPKGDLKISLICNSCSKLWDTASLDARKYLKERRDDVAADIVKIKYLSSLIIEKRSKLRDLEKEIKNAENQMYDANKRIEVKK